MIGEINTKPQAGGIDIQGIVNQYQIQSGENISAGDFIEFINNYGNNITKGTDTQLNSNNYSGYPPLSAVTLSSNKVFVVSSYDNSKLYGQVCTINNSSITTSSPTTLNSNAGGGSYFNVVALSSNKVFIVHGSGSSDNHLLQGIVCTIDGTTITKGTDTTLSSVEQSGRFSNITILSSNKVFISYGNSTSYCLQGLVCSVNGTTISKGNITTLVSSINSATWIISIATLSSNKVFISYGGSYGTYKLNALVCTIDNTTITSGTTKELISNTDNARTINVVKLSEDKVFITHGNNSGISNSKLKSLVCTVNGLTINNGTDNLLSSTNGSGYIFSTVALSKDRVFITHLEGSTYYLACVMCTITNTTITKETSTTLSSVGNSGRGISNTLLSNSKLFIAHDYHNINAHELYGLICNFDLTITVKQFESEINGIAKTSGTSGDTIEIYVPYEQ